MNVNFLRSSPNISKRYIRLGEIAEMFQIDSETVEEVARSAGALYKMAKIVLIHKERFEKYMKHIYRVPDTNKLVIKKFARIGEGSIIYSIGRNRFVEMARAAGATYKMNEESGGMVLVNLEIFDEYMEQFRQNPVPMRHELWDAQKGGE